MTIEEIIEQLDGIVGTYEILIGNGVNSDILDVDDIEAIREAISALSENKGEWIPVSERLPLFGKYKISDDVLITNGYEIDMGYLVERNGKIFWHYYGSDYEYDIKDKYNDAIAWMPLPEPYKEGGE